MKLLAKSTIRNAKSHQSISYPEPNTTKENANFIKRVREISLKNFSLSGIFTALMLELTQIRSATKSV